MQYKSLESIPFLIRGFFKPLSVKVPVMVDVEDLDGEGNVIIVPTHKTETKTINGKEVEAKLYRMETTYVERERVGLISDVVLAAVKAKGNHLNIYNALGKNAEYNQWKFYDKFVTWLKAEPTNGSSEELATWNKARPYNIYKKPEEVQENYLKGMLAIRLAELKDLRNAASAEGFVYKGHRIIADRDAQNDLANIYNQYRVGIKEPNIQTYYKTAPNTYLILMGGQDTLELLTTVSRFIERDCFGTEVLVTHELYAIEPKDLLTVDLSKLFMIDTTTDRNPLPEETTEEDLVM